MDRGAWQATVHGVAKSRTRLSARAHTHTHAHITLEHQVGPVSKGHMQATYLPAGMRAQFGSLIHMLLNEPFRFCCCRYKSNDFRETLK